MKFKEITCTVNGRKITRTVDVRESLTDFLRNELDLRSVKKGCEVGECGACTVWFLYTGNDNVGRKYYRKKYSYVQR